MGTYITAVSVVLFFLIVAHMFMFGLPGRKNPWHVPLTKAEFQEHIFNLLKKKKSHLEKYGTTKENFEYEMGLQKRA